MHLVEVIVRFFLYGVLLISAWFFLSIWLKPLWKSRRRMKVKSSLLRQNNLLENSLFSHLKLLLYVTLNTKTSFALITFLMISLTSFVISVSILITVKQPIISAVLFSFSAGLLPYVLLKIKLRNIRVESSYEGEILIKELVNQYKINYSNMFAAIDETIYNLKNEPYTRKQLIKLSIALKQYSNIEELEQIIQEFVFSIDTEWALAVGQNIFMSIAYGDNVKESLEDILKELYDLKELREQDKRFNSESLFMIKYFAPFLYFGSVFLMIFYFNFTLEKYIYYQFVNPLGLKMFFYFFIGLICSYTVYFLIRKPKNDF